MDYRCIVLDVAKRVWFAKLMSLLCMYIVCVCIDTYVNILVLCLSKIIYLGLFTELM